MQQSADKTLGASTTSCPLSTFHRGCGDSVRKEGDLACSGVLLADDCSGASSIGKSVHTASTLGKISPISIGSDDIPDSDDIATSAGCFALRFCCCSAGSKRRGRPLLYHIAAVENSDARVEGIMKRTDRRPSKESLTSTGSIKNSFLNRFRRRTSRDQTLLNPENQRSENSPADAYGTASNQRTLSLSQLPTEGRESTSTTASVAAATSADVVGGSTLSLTSLSHSHDSQSSSGLRDLLPVLTKEPPPGKSSTMPASGQSSSSHLPNGSTGHISSHNASSSHSASSGYVSSSSSHYKTSSGSSSHSHSQGLTSSGHSSDHISRAPGSGTSSVSDSQMRRILEAATKPESSRKQDDPSTAATANRLADQFDQAITMRPRNRSSVPGPRPNSYQEEPRHAVSSSRSRHQAPQIPMFPMSSVVALQTFSPRLTDYEQEEILEYSDVHYLGLEAKKIPAARGATQNHGYDEENGSYISVIKDHIAYRFEIKEVLGKGSFGHVVKALDHRTNHYVAIKIIRNKRRFHQQAQVELKILGNLNRKDKEGAYNIIRMEDSFHFRNHLCIVFELMGMNLYEVLKANNYRGFSLSVIRKITYSLLQCLKLLRRENIIHCDLKPENILLRPSGHMAVKVIDFGSSCYEHQRVYTYIQSRFYRSPEVILGLPYTCAIDMWSLGCILPELYTGYPLFPGENENEQLACIMQIKGLPPSRLLDIAPRRRQFFDSQGTPRNLINSKGKRRPPGTRSMANACDTSDPLFINFIQQCLHWEASQRMLPDEGLRHPWIIQGRLPRTQTAGYASDSTAGHGRSRSGTTASMGTSSGSSRSQRHHTSSHGSSAHSSALTGSSGSSSSTTVVSSPRTALQHRPQPIGAEQPSEPITKSSKCAKTTSMSNATTEKSASPPLDSKTRHVIGATTQEKNVESSRKASASWSNPSSFLTGDIV
ncbi:dual specificity tyrosine-phosphorylation-regulated kinase mbk-2-like isoform X2 [Sycon ciliatum]|uniref:dual specificity tyrosine-phosphorylation-regulated kinase mbk-2-like isoform X2 n=1 Tax=Sycon ciliatum TaxID=27933 RepID=UPI0031F666BE